MFRDDERNNTRNKKNTKRAIAPSFQRCAMVTAAASALLQLQPCCDFSSRGVCAAIGPQNSSVSSLDKLSES
jgi:hypothetical protein